MRDIKTAKKDDVVFLPNIDMYLQLSCGYKQMDLSQRIAIKSARLATEDEIAKFHKGEI